MKIYSFRYKSSGTEFYVSVKYEAKNLASALKFFWSEAKDFSRPVVKLLRSYEVMNSEGKCSYRFLKDNVNLYPTLDGSSVQTDEPFNALSLGKLRYRDFALDYFTSSLPWPTIEEGAENED